MFKTIFHIGVIGSGKDYRSIQFIKHNKSSIQIAFADVLRDIIWDTICWKPKTKEQYELFKIEKFHSSLSNFTGRDFLTLGEAIKKHSPYFFIDQFTYKVVQALNSGYENVVCSDLRFVLELQSILENPLFENSLFIFCNYKSKKYNAKANYESEKLAQKLISYDLYDGQIIPKEILREIIFNNS